MMLGEGLLGALRQNITLDFPRFKDGSTLREHLFQYGKSTGKWDKRLSVEIPLPLFHLWEYFWELDAARGPSPGGGIQPISYLEIQAWANQSGRRLTAFEIDLIRKMDRACIETLRDLAKGKGTAGGEGGG